MTSPTQRSKKHLEDSGWTVQIVEHWNPFARRRIDLLGFGDLLCLRYGHPALIVQTTSGDHVSHRIAKIIAEPRARLWLSGGGRIMVHGWRQLLVKRGGKARRWVIREEPVTMGDFT